MSLATAAGYATAHWALDEASGNATDDVGSHTGTQTGTVGAASGKFSGSRSFPGALPPNGFTVSHHADFAPGSGDFSISAWVNSSLTGLVNIQTILCKGATNINGSYGLEINDPKASVWTCSSSGYGGFARHSSTASLTASSWNLLIFALDQTANEVRVSLNGGAFESFSISGIYAGTDDLAIGYNPFGEYLDDCLIDDLVVMKGYCMSDADASELWNSGTGVAFADWAGGGGGSKLLLNSRRLSGIPCQLPRGGRAY